MGRFYYSVRRITSDVITGGMSLTQSGWGGAHSAILPLDALYTYRRFVPII